MRSRALGLSHQAQAADAQRRSLGAQVEAAGASWRAARAQAEATRKNLLAAQAGVQRARLLVDECEIRAPRAAVVDDVFVEPGERNPPHTLLVRLVDLDSVKATFYLPNAELGSARIAAPALVVADAWPDREFSARVETVSSSAEFTPRNIQTRTDRDRLVFAVEVRIDNPSAEAAIEAGNATVALVVPRGFERDVERGGPTFVQAIVDGSNPNESGTAQNTIARYFGGVSQRLVADRQARSGEPDRGEGFSLRPRVLYNPRLDTPTFMLPGILAVMLLINTALLTAIGVAREKETGTLEQVLVTPIPPLVLMLGKILPSVVIGTFEFFLGLGSSATLFDLPLGGSFAFLMAVTCLFLLSTLGVGLFVSTFSRTQQQQAFLGVFLFILPANLLGGMLTPVSSMPAWLQPLTWLNPVRYYIEILRATLLEGAGLADLWTKVAALALFGVTILLVSSARFRTRLA